MPLNPLRPPLCVIHAIIADEDGQHRTVARYSPAAPFGTAAWQLPVISGYLAHLRRSGSAPSSNSFATYLEQRRNTPVPAPHLPFPHAPWHDTRVTCLIDLALTPRGSMGWPSVSLVVMQQEAGLGRCSWSRIERRIGYLSVIDHARQEIAAEELRIRERLRKSDDSGVRELQDLATHVVAWTRKLHKAAQGDYTLSRANVVRAATAGASRPSR
ncbi:hypothetical protein ACWD01_33520 [Streptomyces sp. NPDC002835]